MCKAGAGGGLVSPYFGYSDFLANSTRGILLAKCKQDIHTSLRFSSVEARTRELYQELAYSFASGSWATQLQCFHMNFIKILH